MALEDIQTEEVVQEQDEQKDVTRKEISDDECVDEINNSDNPLETALQMIRRGDTYCVIKNIPRFEKKIDHDMERQIIIYAIKNGRQPGSVLGHWENYKLLTKMDKQLIADAFVECDDLHVLEDMLLNNEISNLDRQSRKIFEQVLRKNQELLDSILLKAWSDDSVDNVDSQEDAQNKNEQKDNKEYGSFDEANCMDIMNNASTPLEGALNLINRGDVYFVIKNLSKFENKMNHEMEKKIIMYAIETGRQPGSVLGHWESYKLLTKKDKEEIVDTFVRCGDAHVLEYEVSDNLRLDENEKKIIINSLESNYEYLDSLFSGERANSGNEIGYSDENCIIEMNESISPLIGALRLMNRGEKSTYFVIKNLPDFENKMDHEMEKKIIMYAVKFGRQPGSVLGHWEDYKLLTKKDKEEIANTFVDCGYADILESIVHDEELSFDKESIKIFNKVLGLEDK